MKKAGKIVNFKFLPMDVGRLISSVTLLLFPIKKTYLPGSSRWLHGGALISANHTSFRDPFLVGGIFWYRRTFFLAAEIIMKNKFFAVLLKGMGCIEINRNICDLNAIKRTIALLKDEKIVTVFPQGGIQGEDLSSLKSGIVLMALKSGKPIVPVFMYSRGYFRRGHAVIGKPIYLESSGPIPSITEIEKATQTLLSAMEECRIYLQKERSEDGDNNK